MADFTGIEARSPSSNKLYCWLRANIEKKLPFEISLATSDGRKYQYNSFKHENRDYLYDIKSNSRPKEKINYFGKGDHLRSFEQFFWEGAFLKTRAMFDANSKPLFAKTFRYEGGNVVEEKLWGKLTGHETPALQIDTQGNLIGGENSSRTYSYYTDQNNLLKTEREEEGPSFEYAYKSGADLLISKFTQNSTGKILKREFNTYNDDNELILEIIDDGSAVQGDCMINHLTPSSLNL